MIVVKELFEKMLKIIDSKYQTAEEAELQLEIFKIMKKKLKTKADENRLEIADMLMFEIVGKKIPDSTSIIIKKEYDVKENKIYFKINRFQEIIIYFEINNETYENFQKINIL